MSLSVLRAIRILDTLTGDKLAEGEPHITFTPRELREAVFMATKALMIEGATVFMPESYVLDCQIRFLETRKERGLLTEDLTRPEDADDEEE